MCHRGARENSVAEISTAARDQYNEIAIRCASDLEAVRRQRQIPAGRPWDERFPAGNRPGLGVALEYQRMGNRPVSAALEARAEAAGITFEHLGLTLGSVLHGVDLKAPLTPERTDFLRSALLERKVIFFRDQHLSEEEQVAFSRAFGSLDAFPFGRPGANPYVLEIVHDAERPGTENGWHTDVTWMEEPSLGSVAQCMEAPPIGGDTLFADSHACYLGLPASLKVSVDGLAGVHDYRLFVGSSSLPADLVADIKRQIPFGVTHPLVRTHPETGKQALYLHGGFLRHDSLHRAADGRALGADESRRLSAQLLTQHARPEYQCRFRWEPGSIAFWDNRAVQHYAVSDYFPHRRLLRRVTVSGDRPFHDPDAD
jgi:taurine dioxygenase